MLFSDNSIRCQCETPTHVYLEPNGTKEYSSFPHPFHHQQAIYNYEEGKFKTNLPELTANPIPICRPITKEELEAWEPMITPYVNSNLKTENGEKIISYGVSSYGYDLRIGNKFKIFTNVNSTVVNPKNFDNRSFIDFEGDVCVIPPNSFVLAASLERIVMPRHVTGIVLGKSTYARIGVNCIATPLESEWRGNVTLEFSNTTNLPVMLYANEGAAQVLFAKGDMCNVSYSDKDGKYQNQEPGPVLPKV